MKNSKFCLYLYSSNMIIISKGNQTIQTTPESNLIDGNESILCIMVKLRKLSTCIWACNHKMYGFFKYYVYFNRVKYNFRKLISKGLYNTT